MQTKQKILIVDDKPENIFSLKKVLADIDAQIIEALTGNDALIASLNHDFALAVLDVQMPEMDGYELAELLRSEKKTRIFPSFSCRPSIQAITMYLKVTMPGPWIFWSNPLRPRSC